MYSEKRIARAARSGDPDYGHHNGSPHERLLSPVRRCSRGDEAYRGTAGMAFQKRRSGAARKDGRRLFGVRTGCSCVDSPEDISWRREGRQRLSGVVINQNHERSEKSRLSTELTQEGRTIRGHSEPSERVKGLSGSGRS